MPQLAPPSALDRSAWETEATPDDVAEVAAFVVSVVEPGAEPARTALVSKLLAMYAYTRAELLLIGREAPRANHYGNHVRMDVIDGIVQQSRTLRAATRGRISQTERDRVCAETGTHPDDFACAGFDERNRAEFTYAPHLRRETPAPPPTPLLGGAGNGPGDDAAADGGRAGATWLPTVVTGGTDR